MSNESENKGQDRAAESEFPVDENGPITPPDRPPRDRTPGRESQVPYDSILGSAAEPVNAGRGIIPTDHEIRDGDKTQMLPPDSYNDPPQDSILDDLAQDPSMMIDLEREQKSIRLTPDTMIANRFKVVKELGVGGMGAVYLVEDVKLQEKRALKVMLPRLVADTIAQQRFLTEIKVLQRLSHEAIVRVHDLGVDEEKGLQFFTMEHLPGKTLHKYLHEQGRSLPPAEVIDIAQKLCRALMYAHGKTIHRDLKPANVMLDENMNLTILDFGLAKLMTTAHLQMSNMVMGTFHYQSPEQRYDPTKVDRRTDLFSLGVMIYEMLTGEIPSGNFEPPSKVHKGIPKKLDRIVMRCLQNKPERRYQSAGELYDDLESAKSGLGPFPFSFPGRKRVPRPDETTPPSTPGSMTPQPYARPPRSFGWVIPVALLAVVVAGLGYWLSTRNGGVGGPVRSLDELRAEAHNLFQQVEDNDDTRTYSNIQRIRGNTALEAADKAMDAADEGTARTEYQNAIAFFTEALEAAAAGKQVSEMRNDIVGELNRLAEVEDPHAQQLLFQADDAYRDAVALIEDQEIPDYVEALGLLEAVRIAVDAIPNYLAMVPQKERAEEVRPQVEQRIAELRRRDPAFDGLRSAIDEVVALTANAINAERGDNYTEARSIYEQVANYPAKLDQQVAAIEAEQREIVASARAPAENQLAALQQQVAAGEDAVRTTAEGIEALLQEAADAEANGAFTQAKTLLAKAEQESGAVLARLQTEAEREQQLRDRVMLAKNDLESAESALAELGGNPAEDAKASYEQFMARRTEAEAAETSGNLEEAERLYNLAKREAENVAGAINEAAGERLRLAARDKADELRGAFEALAWDGGTPESFQIAMARYEEANGLEDDLRARQLYNEAGDELAKAIQFVEGKRIEMRRANEERIRLAKAEADEARGSIPQTIENYVQSDLDALKQTLAEAAAAAQAANWDESYDLYAKAAEGFRTARSKGINQAIEAELEQAEARRAAAEKSRQAALARADEVDQARVAQGEAERTKADDLWAQAEQHFNSDAEELEKLNQISLASLRYTEADGAYKQALDLYEQKSQAEIQAEREMRLREDATKGLKDLEGLNSPFKSVGELVARSEAAINDGRFDVAMTTINEAKQLHSTLQTQAANAQQARAQAEQQLGAYPADAPKNSPSYARYLEANTAFQRGESLRSEEKFGEAAETFEVAANAALTAVQARETELSTIVAAEPRPRRDDTTAAAVQATPTTGGGDVATIKQAAELAQAKIEQGPDRDRYSRRDRAKAKQLMDQAAKAGSPQQQIALYTEAKEMYETMKPTVSSTGGR